MEASRNAGDAESLNVPIRIVFASTGGMGSIPHIFRHVAVGRPLYSRLGVS
jgi:hypothetical protein